MRILVGAVAILLTMTPGPGTAQEVLLASLTPEDLIGRKVQASPAKTGWNFHAAPRCRQTEQEVTGDGRLCTFQCPSRSMVVLVDSDQFCPASLQIDLR